MYFFFICLNCNVTREYYSDALLRNHTTHEFGKDTPTDEENEALFLEVQDFILKYKRFVHCVVLYCDLPFSIQHDKA